MQPKIHQRTSLIIFVLAGLFLSACSLPGASTSPTTTPPPAATPKTPDWFNTKLTDVNTGQTFSMNDFAGKVVLVETMATWCPTCWKQENEVKILQELLGTSSDLVLVSLDVDTNEDAATLKDFATTGKYGWRFAIAPLSVARALGNLYSADYLNPPLAPMLFIDRQGGVYGLPNGVKSAESLQKTLAPYLNP
jgi:cytochrome oxidase Cu insertion factor (SCO1/SenC/PrrC family)